MFVNGAKFAWVSRCMASLCLLLLLVSNASNVSAKQEQPEGVITEEIQAQNLKQWDSLPDHWATQEQASLREFFSNAEDRAALRGYFNMASARLIAVKGSCICDGGKAG